MLPNRPERRVRVIVAYDGTDFHGWQVQPGLSTIQGTLEKILGGIEGGLVSVHGSGRTDAGVHAEAQTAAFTLTNPIPADNLRRALNRLLPPAIRILHAEDTALDFHPRFDAVAKTYEYRVFRGEICPPPLWRYVYHHPYPLELAPIREACHAFEGEHDFSAFATADPTDRNERSKVRRIFSSGVEPRGDLLIYRVTGSGFLKHMVRRITGTLLEAGKRNLTRDDIAGSLSGSKEAVAARSAPAKGLHLISVQYEPTTRL